MDTRAFLWQPLGPSVLLLGQADGRPKVSGRVNVLAVHPDGNRIYVASANGGIWYSRDGGANWISVGGLATTNTVGIVRPAQRNSCGALHVEWGATEAGDTVFLGTGEVANQFDASPGSPEAGIGILVGVGPVTSADPDPWTREAPNLVNTGVFAIAREPGAGTMTAATRIGLWQRPAAAGKDVDWVRPTGTPFNTLDGECTDIMWTAASGSIPARCWVWVKAGANMGLWVRDADAANFTRVAVQSGADYAYKAGRASLAASSPPTQIWVLNDRGDGDPFNAGLFRVSNPARPAPPATAPPIATPVIGVPNILRDQGFYDVAVAVDPANPNRAVLAGSWIRHPTLDGALVEYNASIVVGDVAADAGNGGKLTFGHPTTWTHIGVGVHPDVHTLAFSNGGARLWCGCDGGVFRSDRPTSPAGFYPRNAGLSTIESNFIAAHPRCEGNVVAGLQDNGTVERLSSSTWRMVLKGDGGGVTMNPRNPSQFMAQYVRGSWSCHNGAGDGPLVRAGAINTTERDASEFYSMAGAIAGERTAAPAPPVPLSQVVVGTTRLWYSDDFGVSWVTLPTGTDPLPADPSAQDDLGATVTVCRWQSPDVVWALMSQRIVRLARTAGSHNGGGAGTWTSPPETVAPPGYVPPPGKAKKRPPRPPSLLDSPVWTDIHPNLDAGTPPVQRGTKGALYVGTIGHATEPVDTLWWFDGTDGWFPTALRAAVPAPVTALACDPSTPDEVWVGTTVGVWHGLRSFPNPNKPEWHWTQRVNGLPEAAVEDLQIFRDGGLVLLRAAIASRGVWELRLDSESPVDRTYLRVHDDDLRHRVDGSIDTLKKATLVARDLSAPRSWHGSPDVRPREAPVSMKGPTNAVPWTRLNFAAGKGAALRRFQAAFRASTDDPRIVANGVWDAYFSELLRDHGAPTVHVAAAGSNPAFERVQLTKGFWDLHMTGSNATAEPWGAGPPTEADLYEQSGSLAEGSAAQASCTLRRRALRVDVVVHHRGLAPMDGADVRVTLLRWTRNRTSTSARWEDPTTWDTSAVPWVAAVDEVLDSASGITNKATGADWRFVLGGAADSRRVQLDGQRLDAMSPGVATFEFPTSLLAPKAGNSVVLLVAVVRTAVPNGLALTSVPLRDLVLTNPGVAVRSMRISP